LAARARRSYDAVKLQLSSDGGDYGSRKCKRDYGACLEESAFSESLESGGLFCVGAFGCNLASVAVNMFSHLIYLIYKICTCNAICKDNVAINFIPVQ
jgi:hypothetical protein